MNVNGTNHFAALKYATLAIAAIAWGSTVSDSASAAEKIQLFNGKDLTGWKKFVKPGEAADAADKIWKVSDGVIHCTGQPIGYILTEGEYDNYVLRLQWRFPGKPGNSGVFVHVVGPDEIWPKGVEAQLQSGAAGDFWLVGGAKLKIDETRFDKPSGRHYFRMKTDKAVEKPLGEWNQYEITCDDDTIKLVVNGQLVNEGTNSELTRGRILLQSEGAPIEFRNIELEPLKK